MKRFALFAVASLMLASIADAQDKSKSAPSLRRDASTSNGATNQTPEMWFYEQERSRWEDPKEAVRRKAEFRSAQRGNRIASSHWYGMSNSRPAANPTPLFGTYSPTWVSNSFDPNRWTTARDTPNTTIIVR